MYAPRMNTRTLILLSFVFAACGGSRGADDDVPPIETTVLEASESVVSYGHLTEYDSVDDGDRTVDHFRVELTAGSTVRIWVMSSEFDTTVRLFGPNDLQLYNDDGWDGTDSLLQFQVSETADYEIHISSYAPRALGRYGLHMALFSPGQMAPEILLGQGIDGRLTEGGAGPGRGGETGGVWFEAREGQRLRVRATSRDFDTTATLFAPDGQSWYNDDANDRGPDGTDSPYDSTIRVIAPRDGWYQVVVAPFAETETGRFAIATSYEEPVAITAGANSPAGGYAGTETSGRILGLFAGISDYADQDPLYGCADDARFLADAFHHRRLLEPADQILLTDKLATRDAFEAGLHTLAHRAGPNDVVVIFFSGHGGDQPAGPGDEVELDGTDETLVFYDGEMTDNKFADLLDRIRANTIIVAIDACQSGGFARDIQTRPGRIVALSSDEDVFSSTAEPLGAGGYLSYMFRQAVLGHADWRPSDGALQAGELTDYLLDVGVEQHENMNPEGSNDPLQRIIINRGSLAWTDTLWIFPRGADGEPIDVGICLESSPVHGTPAGGAVCR